MPVDENRIPEAIAAIELGTQKALKSTGEKTVKRIEKGFDRSQDAMGRPWTPNAPATVRSKGFNRPLYEFGNLQQSFDSEVKESDREVDVYTEDPKAPIHEFGGSNIPPRPMLRPAAIWAENELLDDEFDDAIGKELRKIEL